MTSVLLHIGMSKTGTTSIQHTLDMASQADKLGEIVYPRFKARNHNLLAALYQPYEALPREYRSRYASDDEGRAGLARDAIEFRERLFEAVATHRRIILSAEYLSRFSGEEAGALKRDLAQAGVHEVCVVVYIRNPASRYLSSVQQALKASSRVHSPLAWRDRSLDVLGVWGELFPRPIVRPFVKSQMVRGDVAYDFLLVASDFFGVDLKGRGLATRNRNQSLSAEGMVVLQEYRKRFYPQEQHVFKGDSNRLRRILVRSMKVIPQTRPQLKESVVELIMSRHVDELDELWQEYGVDLRATDVMRASGDDVGNSALSGKKRVQLHEILETYDEDIVERLIFHALREGLRMSAAEPAGPTRYAARDHQSTGARCRGGIRA